MRLTNPKIHLLNFLDDTPEKERLEILQSFLLFAPEIENRGDFLKSEILTKYGYPVFKAWLDDHYDASDYLVVNVLIARTIIDFFAFRGKKSSEDFLKVAQNQKELIDIVTKEGNEKVASLLEDARRGLPEREIGWLVIADNWRQLCENELSDKYIEQWREENPPDFNIPES